MRFVVIRRKSSRSKNSYIFTPCDEKNRQICLINRNGVKA